jgi:hypothetical protein
MPWSTVARGGGQRRKKPRVLVQVVAGLALMRTVIAGAQDVIDPSPIEHALVEYLCRTVQRPAMIGTDAYQSCYTSQLATVRRPFGRDLASLTAADRKSIDAKCGDFQATRGRDAYLACLYDQLVSIRDRRSLGQPIEAAMVAMPSAPVEPAQMSSPALLPSAQPASPLWWVVGALALAGSAGAAAFVVLKRRTVPQSYTCRGCGAPLPGAGDLCADCRHDAADALRRAIAERADEERQYEKRQRRDADLQKSEHREFAGQEEAVQAREEEARRLSEDRERRLRPARDDAREESSDVDSTADPYVILGLTSDATADEIRSAYEQARARYDSREYEHLGVELQEYFKSKADAVERAYLLLARPE